MSRFEIAICSLFLVNLAGCQCCCLTEHYAGQIDYLADHEHYYENLYSPCFDLNRIGRSDWCSYRLNRHLCRCACERCRPPACGHVVIAETWRGVGDRRPYTGMSEGPAPPVAPTESGLPDDSEFRMEDLLSPPLPAPTPVDP